MNTYQCITLQKRTLVNVDDPFGQVYIGQVGTTRNGRLNVAVQVYV